jgi:hypothetical protein
MLKSTAAPQDQPPLLFTFCANGGASIVDSFLPVQRTATNDDVNSYEAALLDGIDQSPIRCVKNIDYAIKLPVGSSFTMKEFLRRHARDMLVLTQQGTSVNHLIAAKRSLTGNGINQGRTLGEAYSARYGDQFLLPHNNMAIGGYAEPGYDTELPDKARQEVVVDANLFSLSTHGSRAIAQAPSANVMAEARQTRRQLESEWAEHSVVGGSAMVQQFRRLRQKVVDLEQANLFEALFLLDRSRLGELQGLPTVEDNPELEKIKAVFPDVFVNPFKAKVALAYLLVRTGVSGTVTLSMSDSLLFDGQEPPQTIQNLPLGFDWSHHDHRGAQNSMWRIMLEAMSGLIQLLKQAPSGQGRSLWDRSLIYVATEFGRTRSRKNGSGHDLNNGNLLVSPMLKGNQVLGAVDSASLKTQGFDPRTGVTDGRPPMDEGDLYSLICEALTVPFEGRRSFPIAIRS